MFDAKKVKEPTAIGRKIENNGSVKNVLIGIHLLRWTKKSFSAREVQQELGNKRYQPGWGMLHKIRSIMGLRGYEYLLENEVELDDGFFEISDITREKANLSN